LEQNQVYEQQKLDLDAEDHKEYYEHERSDMGSYLFQHDSASFSYFYSSSDLEIITSYFSTVEDTDVYALDCHEKDFVEGDDVFLFQRKLFSLSFLLLILEISYHSWFMMTFMIIYSQFLVKHFICRKKTNILRNSLWIVHLNQNNFKQKFGKSVRKIISSQWENLQMPILSINLLSTIDQILYRDNAFLLDHPNIFHEFYDPITTWMDFSILKISNAVELGVLPICSYEYMFLVKMLLQMSYSSDTFLYRCKHKIHFINLLLAWINWKFVFT
jgi:hypothetical protein